jgi:raffinose/stachyose/melibiose transport system permease protein
MSKSQGMSRYYSSWLLVPALLVFSVFFILPNLANLVLGFTDWTIYYLFEFHYAGLENFKTLFSEETFWIALKNTLYFAMVTVIAKTVLSFLLAVLICKKTLLNTYLRAVFFMPVTISGIVVAIVFVAIYNPQSGVLNTFLRTIGLGFLAQEWLVNVKYAMTAICAMELWQWLGFHMAVFVAGIQSISDEYYEAATIDGANGRQQMWYITVPLILPSVTVNFVFSLIAGVRVFTQVFATTNGGPADMTQVFGTYLFKSFSDGLLAYSSAVGLIMTIVILLITMVCLPVLRKMEVEL